MSISVSANSAINQRAELAFEKLHSVVFVDNPPIITAVTQNHSDDRKSRHTPKITVFTAIVIPILTALSHYYVTASLIMLQHIAVAITRKPIAYCIVCIKSFNIWKWLQHTDKKYWFMYKCLMGVSEKHSAIFDDRRAPNVKL